MVQPKPEHPKAISIKEVLIFTLLGIVAPIVYFYYIAPTQEVFHHYLLFFTCLVYVVISSTIIAWCWGKNTIPIYQRALPLLGIFTLLPAIVYCYFTYYITPTLSFFISSVLTSGRFLFPVLLFSITYQALLSKPSPSH